jgi:hypothetical protein
MGRTAAPATPGTDPNAAAPDDKALGVDPKLLRDAEPEIVEQKVARLEREMAEMRAMVKTLGRNQAAQHAPPVDLPDLADVMKQKPDTPILTKQGWLVPAVLPSQRVVN